MNLLERKTLPPCCPFCGQGIDRPQPFEDFLYEFDGGECSCGAAFGFDPTSLNGGVVLMQTMVQACKGDWDKAQSLSHEEDYHDSVVKRYSYATHRVNAPGANGTLFFIRLISKKK